MAKLVAGDITFNTAKSSGSGHISTITASSTDTFTHGREDSNVDGRSFKHPVQAALKAVGIDTTQDGQTDANFLDTVAGEAVQVIAGLGVAAGADRMTGGHVAKAGKKIYGGLRSAVAGDSVVETSNNTQNSSTYQKDNGRNDNSNPKSTHNKTPSIQSRMTNSNIKTPESKAWYKKIADSFKKTKVGKSVGGVVAALGVGLWCLFECYFLILISYSF